MKLLEKYPVKFSIKSIMLWESITNKPFELRTLTDLYLYVYACMAASGEYKDDYDSFINLIDENPSIINEFNILMNNHFSNDNALYGQNKGEKETNDNSDKKKE
jgi:hypothetical protein